MTAQQKHEGPCDALKATNFVIKILAGIMALILGLCLTLAAMGATVNGQTIQRLEKATVDNREAVFQEREQSARLDERLKNIELTLKRIEVTLQERTQK